MFSYELLTQLSGHLLRLLATNHVVLEAGEDRYAPTAFSLSMGDKSTLVAPALRIRYACHPF